MDSGFVIYLTESLLPPKLSLALKSLADNWDFQDRQTQRNSKNAQQKNLNLAHD